MTSLFVNHEDIRQFIARLAAETPEDRSFHGCLEHVIRCFGLPISEFLFRCKAAGPVADNGLPLDRTTVHALARTLVEHDFRELKNTKRLQLVASAFGWKADAFMHHLKSTTASLGRNPTLADTFSVIPEPSLEALGGGSNMEAWKEAIGRHSDGLYIAVGPVGSGKSTTLQRSASHLAKHASVTIIEGEVPQDGTEEGRMFERAILAAMKGGTTVFVFSEIRSRRDARFALWLAERAVVLTKMHGDSPLQAINRMRDLALCVPVDPIRGVFSQHLVRGVDWRPGRERIMVADFASYDWGDAGKASELRSWESRYDGICADARAKIVNAETTVENVTEVFGGIFANYLDRTAKV
jgi:hypothetical protein